MKKNYVIRLFALMLVLCTLFLNSCDVVANVIDKFIPSDDASANNGTNDVVTGGGTNDTNDNDEVVDNGGGLPDGAYNEGVVLVKYTGEDENVFSGLAIQSAEPLYDGAAWYVLELLDSTKTVEMVQAFADLGIFDYVDYDYVMKADAEVENVEIAGNPNYENSQKQHYKTQGVTDAWKYLSKEGKNPGGSSDVIVAVIDTGVDYNHLDLRNNIWTNPAEIPNNGIDDDGNGYVDDVYGWDCVDNDNDPMDDNGHGTHVAGIVAAENNKIGGVGIAYGCKVMVLKAGNSSGYFNNSDIAEAIQYAYMNGASVINMSFGGTQISLAVEDALEEAYNSCILVAAAGNDSRCNQPGCLVHKNAAPCYPAALSYVIGVMSVDPEGNNVSSFSNFDHYPYNSIEYEVYAVGESVYSTWPNNKYATLNGTSMAAPMIAGMAALLRSYYSDREVYSTKYIQSQIVNTGTVDPYNVLTGKVDGAHSVANVYEALTRIPTPEVHLYDYRIDDSASISDKNNGNGVINAGETVRLYISLHNRGGVASDVNVTIDTIRNSDSALTDPYFTLVNTNVTLSDIGTYSVRNAADGQYFEIVVAEDCPNDYLTDFNIRFTYKNGLNDKDTTNYSGDGIARFNVSNGYYLPSIIDESTTFKNDRLYIVGEDVIVPEGVTVTFEEGCQIQFYDEREYFSTPQLLVYGNLNFEGTKDNPISVYPNERHTNYIYYITARNTGLVSMNYVDSINMFIGNEGRQNSSVSNSALRLQLAPPYGQLYKYYNGSVNQALVEHRSIETISDSYIELGLDSGANNCVFSANKMINCLILYATLTPSTTLSIGENFSNNIVISKPFIEPSPYNISGISFNRYARNNKFVSLYQDVKSLPKISFYDPKNVSNFEFSLTYQKYASQIINDYYDTNGNPIVDVYGSLADASLLWPHVVSVEMFDKNSNPITAVGKEEIKVRVTFNRPMDTTKDTYLTFGTIEPYGDYRIDGEYISDTVWEGTYTLKAQIENGQNYLKVNNACAAEDQTKTVFGEYQLHEFTIDTTAAMAMSLIANPTTEGIELTWAQDDYDTLMGYNIYRSESKDGNFVKINPSILLDTDSTFLDTNAEPGKTYWYTFTVVLSDFSESNPAGRVSATAVDTIFPNIYHTPVNQGYLNNNLVISCTASDNMQVAALTLYYRAVGETTWRTLNMVRVNDKFSATVFGSELTLTGLEYYIVATDGRNEISKGEAENPYTVVIKDASAISKLGDVDGDGVITTKDALMITDHINGTYFLSDDQFKRADLNGDTELTSAEALRILQYINGNVSSLEMN